uniref:Uncharacterized protein n=1 Tax=Lepeophtheirus salmonis TaxID=72036 RepID=A0A0K2VCP2_LEPSM
MSCVPKSIIRSGASLKWTSALSSSQIRMFLDFFKSILSNLVSFILLK